MTSSVHGSSRLRAAISDLEIPNQLALAAHAHHDVNVMNALCEKRMCYQHIVASQQRLVKNQKQSGAAMLIVMLILLSATAVATFAVQSTSYEIRSVGGNKLFVQAEAVSEVALDSVFALVEAKGPEAIDEYLLKAPVYDEDEAPFKDWDEDAQNLARTLGRGTDRQPCGIDPQLYDTGVAEQNPRATRIPLTEIASYRGATPIDTESLGSRPNADPNKAVNTAYYPSFYICAYDQMILETPTPGQELGTSAAKVARRITLTAQSSLRLGDLNNDGDYTNDDAEDGFSLAGYHEVSNSARAHAVTIPYAKN